MTHQTASVAAKMSLPAAVAFALTVGPHAFAQQPSTNPPVPPARAAPGPYTGQAQQAAPGETAQNGQPQVQLIFSPWTKYCARGLMAQSSEIRTKEVCFTASDGHLISGQKLVIALLIEPEGDADTNLLAIQAFDKGKPISFTLPLADFAKAYDGPPSDPTGLHEQQESLTNELQLHSEDHVDTPSGR